MPHGSYDKSQNPVNSNQKKSVIIIQESSGDEDEGEDSDYCSVEHTGEGEFTEDVEQSENEYGYDLQYQEQQKQQDHHNDQFD